MVMFLALHPMEKISIRSFVLLEYLAMLHNKLLTQKRLKQGYRYHTFYRRYYDLISKLQVGLKSLLRKRLSEPEFYGDLAYKLNKTVGSKKISVVH